MSNYILNVDFFGNDVRAETKGSMVSLNDLVNAGNAWRLSKKRAIFQMSAFLSSQALEDYIEAASEIWNKPKEEFIVRTGKGKNSRTMVHLSIALLAAEQISPWFHASVHRTFMEGKLLEFREMGGTEFKSLNAAIDLYLPGRGDKSSNLGVYINTAKLIREKLMGADAEAGCWDSATVAQIHSRYECENFLVAALRNGLVKDYDHLKELIRRM